MFDRDKFRNLVLYIICSAEPSKLGAVKLNKILWYTDVNSYLFYGEPITGEKYLKRQHGPVSEHVNVFLREMEQAGEIIIRDVPCYNYFKKEYISLVEPDLSLFSAQQISLVDQLVNKICREFTAAGISEVSHDKMWQLTNFGEEIPYYTVFSAEMGEIEDSDLEWAHDTLAAMGK